MKKTQKSFNSTISRTTRVRASNPARKRKEFARCYHSEERVKFVQGMACSACGYSQRPSENAHLLGNGGLSRKAGYKTIGALCGPHPVVIVSTWEMRNHIGCHRYYDEKRDEFNADFPDFDPVAVAAETERLWLGHLEEKETK